MLASLCLLGVLFAGCSTATYNTQPFFLSEKDFESHGRKTWFDHLVEVDPGRVNFHVASNYAENPPERIAVLPFTDRGNAQYIVNKIPLSFRDKRDREEWAWTYANRLRRAFTGELAQREFVVVPLVAIDAVLADRGINDWHKLKAVPPEELGRWLDVDAVVYGEVLHYEAYYIFLAASWEVGARIKMVSTRNGLEIFSATDNRYAVDLRPALTFMDIAINSSLTLLELRDVALARAEDEVSREIALRLPVAQRNISNLQVAARHKATE